MSLKVYIALRPLESEGSEARFNFDTRKCKASTGSNGHVTGISSGAASDTDSSGRPANRAGACNRE